MRYVDRVRLIDREGGMLMLSEVARYVKFSRIFRYVKCTEGHVSSLMR